MFSQFTTFINVVLPDEIKMDESQRPRGDGGWVDWWYLAANDVSMVPKPHWKMSTNLCYLRWVEAALKARPVVEIYMVYFIHWVLRFTHIRRKMDTIDGLFLTLRYYDFSIGVENQLKSFNFLTSFYYRFLVYVDEPRAHRWLFSRQNFVAQGDVTLQLLPRALFNLNYHF